MAHARISAASVALCLSFTLVACATSPTESPPQTAAQTGLESKIFNERLWPEEAGVLVRTGEEPKTCLETADTVFLVNDEESFIFMNDGDLYLNKLQWKCNNVLINRMTRPAAFGRRQICKGYNVNLPDRFGGFPNAQCFLGEFEPLRVAQASEAGAITVNEGQTIRRPR